jgi:predicted Zn-dependent protease
MTDKAPKQPAADAPHAGRADVTPELLGQLAGAFAEMWQHGENERALKLAQGLAATFPGSPEVAALLGDCHARCGDLARAVECYVEAATRLPADHPIAVRVAPLIAEARKAFAGPRGDRAR